MRRKRRAACGAAVATILAALLVVTAHAQEPQHEPLDSFPRSHLDIESLSGKQRFEVWIADTASRRAQGLMFVKQLAPLRGMLFLYREPQLVSMWMKNTLIPLDMLFVSADGRIIRIAPRTTPQSLATITSMGPVTGVIEIAGGEAERLGIETGARVLHPAFQKLPNER
jgi:uncharacterized membrane protein (UPF0127 family)